jgi:hypothetical protein
VSKLLMEDRMVFRRFVLAALFICVGCESTPLATQDASFTARVAQAENVAARTMLADSVAFIGSDEPLYTTAILNLAKSMRVFVEAPDGSFTPANREDLRVGNRILVWTTGVEIRTLRPQYTVLQILVLR